MGRLPVPRPLGDDYVRPADLVPRREISAAPPLWVELAAVVGVLVLALLALPDAAEWIATWSACR